MLVNPHHLQGVGQRLDLASDPVREIVLGGRDLASRVGSMASFTASVSCITCSGFRRDIAEEWNGMRDAKESLALNRVQRPLLQHASNTHVDSQMMLLMLALQLASLPLS